MHNSNDDEINESSVVENNKEPIIIDIMTFLVIRILATIYFTLTFMYIGFYWYVAIIIIGLILFASFDISALIKLGKNQPTGKTILQVSSIIVIVGTIVPAIIYPNLHLLLIITFIHLVLLHKLSKLEFPTIEVTATLAEPILVKNETKNSQIESEIAQNPLIETKNKKNLLN